MERDGIRRSVEGPIEEGPYAVEEANYLNEQRSYHFKPNPNLPTHYNPVLRNHENFSYGGGESQGQRQGQNFQQGYHPPRFQQQQQQGDQRNEYQGHKRTQSFEEQMLQFMGDNKKCFTPMNRNFLSWKLLNPTHKCFNQAPMLH